MEERTNQAHQRPPSKVRHNTHLEYIRMAVIKKLEIATVGTLRRNQGLEPSPAAGGHVNGAAAVETA